MTVDQEPNIPPELDYIMQAWRAVSKDKYQDALWLLKEGLRKNSGIAEQIDTSLFIALLRALIVELEIKAEEHFGSRVEDQSESS
jgi:hypothetical protein